MDTSIEQLELKKAILLKKAKLIQEELHLVEAELEYVRKYSLPEHQKVISEPSSVMNKSETSPEQTATGKGISNPLIPVNLEKIQTKDQSFQQKVICTPSLAISEVQANPEQTAPGKDSTNPLKPDALVKSITEVQTSITLEEPSDLNLRPNGGIQVPQKSKEQSFVKPFGTHSKNYYVVYNGPNPGIYNNWAIASLAVTGISGVSHKKFKDFQEARVSADLYTKEMMKPPLCLITSADALKPTFKQALKKTTSSQMVLGKVKSENLIIDFNDDDGETIFDSFFYFYEFGRSSTEQEFVKNRFFTTDKTNISYFNFYPNSDPEMVYEAYVNGLVSLIYPSNNLLEIGSFPKAFREAVKKFRTKCVQNPAKEIFIKIQSSLPFWDEDYNDNLAKPFHYVQLGIVKERSYAPSESRPVTLEKKDLKQIAIHKYAAILEKILCIKESDKVKINYSSSNCIMTSMTHTTMSQEDKETLEACKKRMTKSQIIFDCHYPEFCKASARIIKRTGTDESHLCQYCQESPTMCKSKEKAVEEE